MYIKYLSLLDFRNYGQLNIELNKSVNVLTGDNAQGKTNILESIYFCSIGKSHRTSKDKELVKWGSDNAYIKLYVCRERLDKKIEVKILKEGKKAININSIKVNKISELMGNLNVVMFSPEDLKIVKESAAFRRKFLDIELCKLSNKYYYNLVQYNKVLDERNIVIKKWDGKNEDIIEIYDRQLGSFGGYIIREREKYLRKLNEKAEYIHKDITNGMEEIKFKYITSVKNTDNAEKELFSLLSQNRNRDFEKRMTSQGPHREDFSIFINDIDTRSFGSQGQQRTSVLSIKFASLEIIKEIIGEYPVLLLDDVLSELDDNRQKYILNSIKNIQTIITSTGLKNIQDFISEDATVFDVKSGTITEQWFINNKKN
jgi:DNA replication and repair protein RecF